MVEFFAYRSRNFTFSQIPGGTTLGVLILASVAFLLAPWSFDHKAHAALHGLCAQIPSHTFEFASRALPFDARMTGIYGGFAFAFIYLLARGRIWSAGVPTVSVCVCLAVFVGVMGVDGTNSLLLDLRLPYAYEPDNRLRLLTGGMTGVTLAVTVVFLLASSIWRSPRFDEPPVTGVREVLALLALSVPFGLIVVTGPSWLFVPVVLTLLVSAVAVVTSLALVVIVMVMRWDGGFGEMRQLDRPVAAALVAGLAIMAIIAASRFALEAVTGTQMVMGMGPMS